MERQLKYKAAHLYTPLKPRKLHNTDMTRGIHRASALRGALLRRLRFFVTKQEKQA